MAKVSVIIPARNETYLQRTIESVLAAARGDIEVIAVCDGYWPDPPIKDDPRVILIHHTEARGQRQSINEAARIAKGKYIMKLDAHCAVDEGFDVKLAADCQYNWTVIPRMYNLDHETWQPKLHKRTDYMYIGFNEKNELRSLYYTGDDWKRLHTESPFIGRHGNVPRNSIIGLEEKLIDDTMGCMGPCFFMHKERFWELGGCDENHGGWGQQGIEVALKAWLSGGALKVNKKTWFAHWFRGGSGPGFPYHISGREVDNARKYSMDLWLNDKWPQAQRPLAWLVEKFNPPGWEKKEETTTMLDDKRKEINNYLYYHLHKKHHDTKYRGITAVKMPSDMLLYHRVIWETKPELIIEIGTRFGGSALYLQDQLDLVGESGWVITVDIRPQVANPDPRITYLIGDSLDPEISSRLREAAAGKRTMLILDGKHTRVRVKNELHRYARLVTPGCYLVIEDCYSASGDLYGPGEARDWFLSTHKEFEQTNLDQEYLVGFLIGGWLRRR